ncbi:MAG: glycosyltransferase, partial [Methanomassiliicoccales archaeon]|nr:glycosyltransferase [Methanomassiliicoccales archaeon]
MGCVVDEHEELTIILPTYNEAGNIQPMLETLSSLYPGASIIVADDNSKDNTQENVLDFANSHPLTRLLRRDPADRGLTASIVDGIMSAETAHFVVMDADFQHPPGSVDDLHVKLK